MNKAMLLLLMALMSFFCSTAAYAAPPANGTAESGRSKLLDMEGVVAFAEVMPKFDKRDVSRFEWWLAGNLKYPEEAAAQGIAGRLTATFVVEKDGSIVHTEIMHSPDPILSAEVEKALRSSPKWTPGTHKGKRVRVCMPVSVTFEIFEGVPIIALTERALTMQRREVRARRERFEATGDSTVLNRNPETVMPSFRGKDIMAFREWANNIVQYPPELVRSNKGGSVMAAFVIDEEGRLGEITIPYSTDPLLSKEVTRVLKRSPRWAPGTLDGKPVKVKFTLPFEFSIPPPDPFSDGRSRVSNSARGF